MKKTLAAALSAVAVICLLLLTPAALATAPVAENLELTTYKGVSVGGRLNAYDADGGAITYELATEPTKGTVVLNEDGKFVYTPDEGKRGKDYFGYTAVGEDGERSQEATVIIRISKQKTEVFYSDLDGDGAAYPALLLAERGVFVGEYLGGEYVFDADREVTRGEFLAMCMSMADTKLLSGVSSTGFSDDLQIPAWVKPYVSTALMKGYVSGYFDNAGAFFNSQAPVTNSEAAVMLDNILGLSDVPAADYEQSELVPVWACQAAANLDSCNIIYADTTDMSAGLTRGEAAEILAAAIAVLDKR